MTTYRVYVQCTAGTSYEIEADNQNQAKKRSEEAMLDEVLGAVEYVHFDWGDFTAVEIDEAV